MWPELIRPHPYLLGIFGLIGVLLMAAPFFKWPTSPEIPQVASGIIAGRDNTGHQIVSQGDVYIGSFSGGPSKRVETPPIPFTLPIKEQAVLDIDLTPHGNNSDAMYLEVMNNGSPTAFSAEVHILRFFPSKEFKTHKFDGRWVILVTRVEWMDPYEELIPEIKIGTNRSKRLKLASVVSPVGSGMQIVQLEGIDEFINWELPVVDQILPYVDIEIMVIGNGYPRPVTKQYRLGPRTPVGPLEMKEIAVND